VDDVLFWQVYFFTLLAYCVVLHVFLLAYDRLADRTIQLNCELLEKWIQADESARGWKAKYDVMAERFGDEED
jgi:hypothetical protein